MNTRFLGREELPVSAGPCTCPGRDLPVTVALRTTRGEVSGTFSTGACKRHLIAAYGDIGDTLAAVGDGNRQNHRCPARVMTSPRSP